MADPHDTVFDPREILESSVDSRSSRSRRRACDVMLRPNMINSSRVGEALAQLGARIGRGRRPVDVTDPHLLKRAALVPAMTDHGRLDLLNTQLISGPADSYDHLREAAVEVELGGYTLAVAGPDDLIRMKRAAGREQDLADIGALARTDEELEREST